MNKIVLCLVILIKCSEGATQFSEINFPTTKLTPHWRVLPEAVAPVKINGLYYFKLDDNTFASSDGTAENTRKLDGFGVVKNIAYYVATSKYLYYTVYADGKVTLHRYDPVSQQHTSVKNGNEFFSEPDQSVLVFSPSNDKLVVSCWEYRASTSKTFTKLYAIHDADIDPGCRMISASMNKMGILDGPVGFSNGEIITMFNHKTNTSPDKTVIFAFGYKDSIDGYRVSKEYDFSQIGLQINSMKRFGNDVLFVLADKSKFDAKVPALSIWLLRNKSAKKLGDLPSVKSNSLKEAYVFGERLYFIFDEGVYTFNSRTGLLTNEFVLSPTESLGMMTPRNYLWQNGDTLWFRVGTAGPNGAKTYALRFGILSTKEFRIVNAPLPDRFQNGFLFDHPAMHYLNFNGSNIYVFDINPMNKDRGQLKQYSLTTGEVKGFLPPDQPSMQFEAFTEVLPLMPSVLLIKANYINGNENVVKTFLFKMP